MPTDTARDIRQRSFLFGCQVARLALTLTPRPAVRSIVDQLVRSATAIGANLEEAKASSTRREFLRGLEIALREARETHYWLRVCSEISLGPPPQLLELQGESDQLIRILTAIVLSTKRRMVTIACLSAFCILNSALLVS
jgi:four helix bundle protein